MHSTLNLIATTSRQVSTRFNMTWNINKSNNKCLRYYCHRLLNQGLGKIISNDLVIILPAVACAFNKRVCVHCRTSANGGLCSNAAVCMCHPGLVIISLAASARCSCCFCYCVTQLKTFSVASCILGLVCNILSGVCADSVLGIIVSISQRSWSLSQGPLRVS